MKKINAFIPAAGYGERLRPITLCLPKPLLPILGLPVIETILSRLTVLPVEKVGINIHHKPELMKEWALSSPHAGKITIFHEDPILGTGGALKNAESLLGGAHLLVHNADIFSDIDLKLLFDEHLRSGNMATLAVHDHNEFNNVWIRGDGSLHSIGRLKQEGRSGLRVVAFTGIAVYSPDFLGFLPAGSSSVVDAWLRVVASGMKIATMDFTGSSWSDIGTPDSYARLVFKGLRERGETIYTHPSICCDGSYLGANTVIEQGSLIGKGARLANCIALPGARIEDGTEMEDAIIGPDYVIPLSEAGRIFPSFSSQLFPAAGPEIDAKISLIGTGGSDRNYYRIRTGNKSAVLMACQEGDVDLERHLLYTEFFRNQGVPVPELLSADMRVGPDHPAGERVRYVLFEDLGDVSLYSWLKCRRAQETIESLYRRILDILAHLHSSVSANIEDCPTLESRVFDYDHFRWETGYFCERFVSGLLEIALPDRAELDGEFEKLARHADSFAKTIVHRDFQSQNIMVAEDDLPRIIDFQGARIGPPAYDLVSLLWDPYHRLDDEMRGRLADYYIDIMTEGQGFDENTFRQSILPCRLQRHMQALGAYGFLSKVKGKTYFKKYIPQALLYLNEETEAAADEYPVLFRLLRRISEKTTY